MGFTERSAATRTAILAAARKLLAQQGYDATTIRAVAAEVGVDPSMVMRYYGNKAGLFAAAVDVDLYLEKVPQSPKKQLGEALARHFLSRWEGELSDEATTLLLRSTTTNAEAAERMRTIFETQVTKFVRDCAGGGADAAHRAGLVSSQLLGLALTRYIVALPPVAEMDVNTLVESVAPVLQYYLTGDLGSAVKRRVVSRGSTGDSPARSRRLL
jgi:AcrR family transcriptional regulator